MLHEARMNFRRRTVNQARHFLCRAAASFNPGLEISLFPDSAGNKGRFAQPKIDNLLVRNWGLGLTSRSPLHAVGIELNRGDENAGCLCRLSCALNRGRLRLRGSPGSQLLLPPGAGRRRLPHLLAPVEGR